MNHEINLIPKRLLEVWRGEGIIAGNNAVMFFCQQAQRFYIYSLNSWICRRFQVKHPDGRIILNSFFRHVEITQVGDNRCNPK